MREAGWLFEEWLCVWGWLGRLAALLLRLISGPSLRALFAGWLLSLSARSSKIWQ
jgi:hypothetical protein